MIAGYVRVSTSGQDDGMQRDAIEKAARARGDKLASWFSDTASGDKRKRPELGRLLEAVRAGDVRKVYVYRLDRLTRAGVRDMLAIFDQIRQHGATITSIADGFDVDGPFADVILAVFAACAQIELSTIRERLADARERARSNGTKWGRPRRMTDAELVQVEAYQAEGRSMRWIAAAMKIPRPTLQRSLARKSRAKPLRKAH